jgi:hypothetical protein
MQYNPQDSPSHVVKQGRPSPLDPEYWRGITHSGPDPMMVVPPHGTSGIRSPYKTETPAFPSYLDQGISYPPSSISPAIHHPVVISPIPQARRIFPVAEISGGFDTQQPEKLYGANNPNTFGLSARHPHHHQYEALKSQLRLCFSMLSTENELRQLFQAYDVQHCGGLSYHALQDCLSHLGAYLSPAHMSEIQRRFYMPHMNNALDYHALASFIALDHHEV